MSCVLEALNKLSGKDSVAPPKPAPSRQEQISTITPENVRLTRYASGLGCACKMKAPALMEVLHSVKKTIAPSKNLLVGYDNADDASIYKLNDDVAIVNTTDFFPPIIDNPREYGRIAAANALSDVYAMGGKPLTALSVSTFPTQTLPLNIMSEILQGAEEKAAEAGCVICGGHTLDISELIFGLAVTGTVHPEMYKTNGSSKVEDGDILILTKPLGTGIVTTLLKKEKLARSDAGVDEVVASMSTLNKRSCEILCTDKGYKFNKYVHALTDVTGYGLAGHLSELVRSSSTIKEGKCQDVIIANVNVDKVKFFDASLRGLEVCGALGVPGGSIGNSIYAGADVEDADVDACSLRCCISSSKPNLELIKCLLVDPQTSGGLLAAVKKEKAEEILNELRSNGIDAAIIGNVRRIGMDSKKTCMHSRYVVFTDDNMKGEEYLENIDNSMNTFDILNFLAKGMGGSDASTSNAASGSAVPSTASTKLPSTSVSAPFVVGMEDWSSGSHSSTTLFIRNTTIGSGDPVLGKKLLLAHLAKLSQRENLGTIRRIIFMNTGVRIPLGLEDPRYTAILKALEAKGVDVCACGTCIDHYAYSQASLVCGRVSSADENLDLLSSASESCVTLC